MSKLPSNLTYSFYLPFISPGMIQHFPLPGFYFYKLAFTLLPYLIEKQTLGDTRPSQQADAMAAHQEMEEFLSIAVRQGKGQGHAQLVLAHPCAAGNTFPASGKPHPLPHLPHLYLLQRPFYKYICSLSQLLQPFLTFHSSGILGRFPSSIFNGHLPDHSGAFISYNALSENTIHTDLNHEDLLALLTGSPEVLGIRTALIQSHSCLIKNLVSFLFCDDQWCSFTLKLLCSGPSRAAVNSQVYIVLLPEESITIYPQTPANLFFHFGCLSMWVQMVGIL